MESFYAVPQIGAVLVPLNDRLTADDFAYLIQHSGESHITGQVAEPDPPVINAQAMIARLIAHATSGM